ncbi:hypothetical protein ACLB1E_08755 [Escherichia coli]
MQENYKILVVDDDMRLRALLERYLTEQGFQVRSVANAEQMDRLSLILPLYGTGWNLPGEDGLWISRRLQ